MWDLTLGTRLIVHRDCIFLYTQKGIKHRNTILVMATTVYQLTICSCHLTRRKHAYVMEIVERTN